MDSDAQRAGSLVITALARDGPSAVDSPSPAPAPAAITSSPARARSTPETFGLEALAPGTAAEGLSALIGALALRALRSQRAGR